MHRIPIVIPSYEPDERLINIIKDLHAAKFSPIILVNDGSGKEYDKYFNECLPLIELGGGTILIHESNLGKGRALKTAFSYIIDNIPDSLGCVTADSDGQHTVECIEKVKNALRKNPNNLILGSRNFDVEYIPWKSKYGNKLTKIVMGYSSGIWISDTQTGLRGIPISFMNELLKTKGDRFEFETNMLLKSKGKHPITEVEIKTIYDSKTNHKSHFHPIVDSFKIYVNLFKQFFSFLFTSLSSAIIDVLLFTLFIFLLKEKISAYIAISTFVARIISATYNYLMNYFNVFKSEKQLSNSAIKYVLLAIIQMTLSAAIVTGFAILCNIHESLIKIFVDTILFFISFKIQQKFIF